MFETAILNNSDAPRRVWTTGMGITGQALLVLGAVLVPIVSPQVLPQAHLLGSIFAPTAPEPPNPIFPDRPIHVTPTHPFQSIGAHITRPVNIPPRVLDFVDPPNAGPDIGRIGAAATGPTSIGLERILSDLPIVPQVVPRPPQAVRAASSEIIRVRQGGLVKSARIVYRVEPIYPHLAQISRISGTVQLEGVIATNGRICELKVLSGHPLLVKAALDAVRQWVYEPTTLNGDPVEVIAPITVTFRLSN